MESIFELEAAFGVEAEKAFLRTQPGDVPSTYPGVSDLLRDFGY